MRRPAFGAGQPCATGQISFLPKAILACFIALVAVLNLHAQFPTQKPTGYVNDLAGVLSPAARQQLEALCAELDQKTKAQLAIVTVKSLEGRPLEEFTVDLATKWGIGPKGSDRGVMLFLAIQDRRSRIEVGYGLEPIIPDGRAGGILRAMTPYLRNNDYDGAMRLGATTIAQIIAQDAGVALTGAAIPRPTVPSPITSSPSRYENEDQIPWWVGLLIVIIAFFFFRERACSNLIIVLFIGPGLVFYALDTSSIVFSTLFTIGLLAAFYLGIFVYPKKREWTFFESGDNGGGGGGGGFGGFGGGSFGGGGASGSW